MSIVYFGGKKRLHINSGNYTLCGKRHPNGAVLLDEVPTNGKFCRYCMAEVGEHQLGSYLGLDAFTQKTLKQLLKEETGGVKVS